MRLLFWCVLRVRLSICGPDWSHNLGPPTSASWVAQERLLGQWSTHKSRQATMRAFRFKQIHSSRCTRHSVASGRCQVRRAIYLLALSHFLHCSFVVKSLVFFFFFQFLMTWVSHKEAAQMHHLGTVKWLTGQKKTRGDSNSYCILAHLFC